MPAVSQGIQTVWRWGKEEKSRQALNKEIFGKANKNGGYMIVQKYRKTQKMQRSVWDEKTFVNERGTEVIKELFNDGYFSYPKSIFTIKRILELSTNPNDIILDFFAGSGTTGHAVMQLNAEDGGNRKFILCQIDEPIDKSKPAFQFCKDNGLEPIISSITIERLNRAGEKIIQEINEEGKQQIPDIGYKGFDSVDAPQLEVQDGQIIFPEISKDTMSRIYNMILTVGLDAPTQIPEEVVTDSVYKIGNHYYITNSERVSKEDFSNVIKSGSVFIDGWTATLNGTMQHYKEEVKIVF
nr:DNA methyltransferase [Riemerella columbina]